MWFSSLPMRAARVLMGSTFVALGSDAFRAPGGRVATAGAVLAALRRMVPLPADDELLVRANGATQAACGAMLALGILPRLSAGTIAVSLLPTTLAGHPYWTMDDPAQRAAQRVQFLKNVGLTGGLLFSIVAANRAAAR